MAFAATRALEVVIKRSGGLVWKNWPMNHTRRANAKKRHLRLQQVTGYIVRESHKVESVLKACAAPAPSSTQSSRTQISTTQTPASK